jgi:hypothetical protein
MDFFGTSNGNGKYRPVAPDSDSDDEGGDFIQQHIRNQKVCCVCEVQVVFCYAILT